MKQKHLNYFKYSQFLEKGLKRIKYGIMVIAEDFKTNAIKYLCLLYILTKQ